VKTRPADSRATYRLDAATLGGDWPIWVILATDLAFGLWAWPRMPAIVPVHFGLHGEANGWGPSWINAVGVPALAAGMYLLLLCIPLIDPRRRNYATFPGTLRLFRTAVPGFLVGVHVLVTLKSLGYRADIGLALRVALPVLFILMGNAFARIRFNYFFGIRTPWTLDNERVWTATHRMAGRVWVIGGLLMLGAAFLPATAGAVALGAMIAAISLWPIVFSYRMSRRLADEVNSG
jgi:immunity protein, SdpI family